ncbi:MAG: FHA domain-containing protein [Planctomycetota bacterium]|nr:FHA domain-containing protein [Planctomycetota bacterium]
MRIRLNCRSGSLTGQAFEFDGPTVTLGSEPDCTLQLDAQKEPRVSHRHCEFFEKDEQWFVKDLKSRNGTLVNGFRIHEPVPVQFGSSIRLGKDGPEFSLAAPRSDSPLTMMGELFPDKAMKVQRTKLGGDSDEESKKRLKTEIVLTCTRGALEGQSFSFEEPLITLGRDPSNKLQVDPEKDLRASGKHCEIFLLAGRFIVRDLESSHGTFVDGKRVAEPTLLTDGSTLALGQQGPLFAVKVANSMALPLEPFGGRAHDPAADAPADDGPGTRGLDRDASPRQAASGRRRLHPRTAHRAAEEQARHRDQALRASHAEAAARRRRHAHRGRTREGGQVRGNAPVGRRRDADAARAGACPHPARAGTRRQAAGD